MGVAVSAWQLAKAASRTGQLGVVAGTAIDTVLIRRLQSGDLDGHIRRAFEEFPMPEMAARVVDRYLVPGGKPVNAPFASTNLL